MTITLVGRNVRLKLVKQKRFNILLVCVGITFLVYVTRNTTENLFYGSNNDSSNNQNNIFDQLKLTSEQFQLYLAALNRTGKSRSVLQAFKIVAQTPDPVSDTKLVVMDHLRKIEQEIRTTAESNPNVNTQPWGKGGSKLKVTDATLNINVATIACGAKTKMQAMVMIKSAVIFSQDVNLNVIVFSDNSTILSLGQSLLELKWTVNQLGYDFTFELFQEWFPPQGDSKAANWREMWQPCATQRLFFPSLLPHIDSLIYLDADTIVLSNLTQMWFNFDEKMTDPGILAAMAANTEYPALGHYNLNSKIPYYGFGGLNAGVLLMNLTRMREFGIQQKSIDVYYKYRNEIVLADQDIYNIIFHFNPEKVFVLDCSYNVNWVHCGGGADMHCVHNKDPGPICFCYECLASGLKIAHGNMGTFFSSYPFLMELYKRFMHLDLLKNSTRELIHGLKTHFKTLETPCFFLSDKTMYRNAEDYLENIFT